MGAEDWGSVRSKGGYVIREGISGSVYAVFGKNKSSVKETVGNRIRRGLKGGEETSFQ